MAKNRLVATYTFSTSNITNYTVSSVDLLQPVDNLLHFVFTHSNELDYGLVSGNSSIDKTVYEDWGSIE